MHVSRLRRALKETFERLTRTRIYRTLPQGVDLFSDLRRLVPCFSAGVVFDVGANVGQSTKEVLAHFPNAEIYCFEPVSSTFSQLLRNVGHHANVRCFQQALGKMPGRAAISLYEDSVLNAFSSDPSASEPHSIAVEEVAVETLTEFCREHGVERIDFLKIDTEGQDLAVLEGAAELLDKNRIGIVQVEAAMNPTNTRHVPLQAFLEFLQPRGYLLFGLYEQIHERPTKRPILRRANPVFLSERVAGRTE